MDKFSKKLKKILIEKNITAQHFVFSESCHTVEEASRAVNASVEDLVKSICLIDAQGGLIVGIVKGEDRVSTTRVGEALGIEPPRVATREEVLEKTGFPAGGTPAFGYQAIFLIDPKVIEKEQVYSGGGSENSLLKISTAELQKANNGKIVRIRK
jgi:prolyl-tRNA editing enzyme YbaK/EbsC (Cys-tRNA(Pro) deacylase)